MTACVMNFAKRYLSDRDIYEIAPIRDLEELLRDGHSLCLIWRPQWIRQTLAFPTVRGTLHTTDGESEEIQIVYALDLAPAQVKTKNTLDRFLIGRYLFASWKKSGKRTFRILESGREIASFPTLPEAVDAWLPGRFEPAARYRRKLSIFAMAALEMRRRREYKKLMRLFSNRIAQLKGA